MERMEHGVWVAESTNKVTRVGAFLRKASIDEFPQFINILKGEMSLIGPRSDIIALAKRLEQAIPFYNVRYTVKPGITGWAQVRQQYRPGTISPQSVEETKVRLTYDLYYIKNRSLMLDISIALRTISTLLSRFGIRLEDMRSLHRA
jgi:lipopolysaccharide/colanic/teichoic acid biosynthesis glycosyltransferase